MTWRNEPWTSRKPARWWCPDRTYFRLGPLVLSVSRRWWPHKNDGYHECANCGRREWIAGWPKMGWCRDCSLLHRQITGFLGPAAPAHWLWSVQQDVKRKWSTP